MTAAPGSGPDRPAAGQDKRPATLSGPQAAALRAAFGHGLLFMVIGGLLALFAGFGFTAIAGTSCFDGFCAYLPYVYFAPLGMVAGFVLGAKLGGRRAG